MKKWIKGFAITGVVLLCLGTGITALAGAVGGVSIVNNHSLNPIRETARRFYWNSGLHRFYNAHDKNYEYDYEYEYDDEYEYDNAVNMDYELSPKDEMTLVDSYENIKSLDLSVVNGIVHVVENPELTNTINVYQKKKEYSRLRCNRSENRSKLSIEYASSFKNKGYQIGYYEEGLIEIPVDFHFSEADIEGAGSKVYVQTINADELSLEVAGAEMRVDSFRAGKLSADSQAGSLTATGEVTDKLEADADAGQITLMVIGAESDFGYELEASMGDINIGGNSYSGVALDKQINNQSNKKAELSCAMGQIDLNFFEK